MISLRVPKTSSPEEVFQFFQITITGEAAMAVRRVFERAVFTDPHSEKLNELVVSEIVRSFPFYGERTFDAARSGLEELFSRFPNEEDRCVSRRVAGKLIRFAPKRLGLDRSKDFIRVALLYISPEMYARAYLRSFPSSVTERQELGMVRHLAGKPGLSEEKVYELILHRRFERRTPTLAYRHAASAW